jgi:micrococcal nuclease
VPKKGDDWIPPGLRKEKNEEQLKKWLETRDKLKDWKPDPDRKDLPKITEPIPEPCSHNDYCIEVKPEHVYDGDTIKDLIIHSWPSSWNKASLRLARINTPEIRTKDDKEKEMGYVARDILRDLLVGEEKRVRARLVGMGPYNRYITELWVMNKSTDQSWTNVNDWMLSNGYAQPYKD